MSEELSFWLSSGRVFNFVKDVEMPVAVSEQLHINTILSVSLFGVIDE